jgi:DNA polymerase III delta prime subunit
VKPPDILNSKIKKIRIELPHYSFSHSSSGDSPHAFIGRERIREKLKKVIEDSPDEPGVYLIAGNRGVGKTSLVSWVINETSLKAKSNLFENLRYVIFLLLAVGGTQFCLQVFNLANRIQVIWPILFSLSFITLCLSNSYRLNIPKQKDGVLARFLNCIKSAFKELSYLINPYIPIERTQYLLKIIFVVCYTQIASKVQLYSSFPFIKFVEENSITPTKACVFYLCFVFAFMFQRYIRDKLREYYRKYKKDKFSEKTIAHIENKGFMKWIGVPSKLLFLLLLFLPLCNNYISPFSVCTLLIISIPFIMEFILICSFCCIYLKKGFLFKFKCIIQITFLDSIIKGFSNYIKNHNRLYLRINFGHKLNDEKDILRLIARTLSTEYNKFRRSFRRMLPRRVLVFGILFLFAYLFTPIIERQEFYSKLLKGNDLYKASSQGLLISPLYLKDSTYMVKTKNSNYFVRTNDYIFFVKTKDPIFLIKDRERLENIFDKKDIKVGKVGNILFSLDQLVFEMTKIIEKIPQYFWEGRKYFDNIFFPPINYLSCSLFLLMYLFCKLLFGCNLITHFFVTHQIIRQRLKKLNIDITHSTERENSIRIGKESDIAGIGAKIKKTRNIADAREIEKELQDIFIDIQRIPIIMCRPNVVFVFDELDKVEPGDASLDKENPQTKASLFSIHATRERQTEILRILSNMKYFLSTAKAKFIFIAGREMFDIHLADVSERNNYIGSIFNVVILVPSFLTDHHTGKKLIPQESSIASLPEEFVCRRLIPYDYPVESFNLNNYQKYLKNEIFFEDTQQEEIQKVIAILQQFIIYLAHVSKGAPKKMMQLFESFVEIHIENGENRENTLFVQHYHNSRHFLSFNYYKQYTLGIIAYLITPIFYRLAESNIKELSDKLLVSSLRFVDFLFKFHKHSFSWKHLDMSPEMLEVNRAPELKSVAVDLLNYLSQVHINKSNFSLSDYKFDGLIANEIFAMAKTDEVFSALFSFSLDEMLPLKKHYQDLLEKTEKEYKKNQRASVFIDAISSLQGVLGDLHYYDDELEEAEAYYKKAVQALHNEEMKLEQLYVYVRNMLRLGIIYEKRKQYDFAYLTYGELCERIIHRCKIARTEWQNKSPNPYNTIFEKLTFEGLKMLYLPFIAKLQILEQSHIGGISSEHLNLLNSEFEFVTFNIDNKEAKLLKAEFYSRVADILYYKNSDLECKKGDTEILTDILPKNCACTACNYYHKALSTLLYQTELDKSENKGEKSVVELLIESVKQIKGNNEQIKENYNMRFCTILARILSDWGNVFFSCDNAEQPNDLEIILQKYINYMDSESEEKNRKAILDHLNDLMKTNIIFAKIDIAFAMYAISSVAYRRANLYKRSSYQIYKMLCLFKDYKIYNDDYIEQLSKKAIHYLYYANDDLNLLEVNKRKNDFDKTTIKDKDIIPLQYLLVDTEITRIRILVKELTLKSDLNKTPKNIKKYYDMRITSPYKINYSIAARIYRLRLKSKVNYKAYRLLLERAAIQKKDIPSEIKFILENERCNETAKKIFGDYFNFGRTVDDEKRAKIKILENLIAESIYCLIDIAQLVETMDETYLFPHSFIGSVHKHLSFWIRLYETYERDFYEKYKDISQIKEYLKQYLDEEWREQLSGYRENQRALSHYYKCLEMHNEGRAYHNMIDTMCYLKDDYNDRSDHFNIAEERHLIVNGDIEKNINAIKDIYEDSKLYKAKNYF